MTEELVEDLCPKNCAYRMNLGNGNGTPFCGYALTEHRMRGCKVSECDKYRKGKRRMRRNPKGTIQHADTFKWVIEDEDGEEWQT